MDVTLSTLDWRRTALLLVDLQVDFLDPGGAYGRAGQCAPAIAELASRITPLAQALKLKGGLVAASRFTLWPDATGEPMISPHLKSLRPFLARGDFAPGSTGQQVVWPLREFVDFSVDKVAYSAFFNTQLDWVLRRAGIEQLIFSGIVTQGGVASSVRDAHVRDFHPLVLSDGCATFSQSTHDIAIQDMASIAQVITCDQLAAALNG